MGPPIKYEPSNINALYANIEAFNIFSNDGWIGYFQRLKGFHEERTLHFYMNLVVKYLEIIGLRIDASEWDVKEVTGLNPIGDRWFFQKRHNLREVKEFLAAGEQV